MKIFSIFRRNKPDTFSVLMTTNFPKQRRSILESSIKAAGEEQRREEGRFKEKALSLQR